MFRIHFEEMNGVSENYQSTALTFSVIVPNIGDLHYEKILVAEEKWRFFLGKSPLSVISSELLCISCISGFCFVQLQRSLLLKKKRFLKT